MTASETPRLEEAIPTDPTSTGFVYLSLSGGGAKGLGHVGVLKALEESELHVAGYAGTSAGAIVAALAAAGYRADELVNVKDDTTLFSTRSHLRGKRPVDFIAGWQWLKLARTLPDVWKARAHWVLGLAAAILVTAALLTDTFEWMAVVLAGLIVAIFFLLRGLASLEPLRYELAHLLEAKLGQSNPTFADLARCRETPLKVVAANLSTRQLELFSAEMTPDVPIADAVIASSSIPVLFRLPTIYMDRTELRDAGELVVSDWDSFCDGGVVSNLPAWLWDEERDLHPTAVTVAADISASAERRAVNVRGWLAPLVQTALFGSSELNLRATGRIEHVRLESELNLLEFDAAVEKVIKQVESAHKATKLQIDRALVEIPERMILACNGILRTAGEYFDDMAEADSAGTARRVAVLGNERGLHRSLRLEHAKGFSLRAGDRPLVRTDRGAVGAAWQASAFVLETQEVGAFSSDPDHLDDDRLTLEICHAVTRCAVPSGRRPCHRRRCTHRSVVGEPSGRRPHGHCG